MNYTISYDYHLLSPVFLIMYKYKHWLAIDKTLNMDGGKKLNHLNLITILLLCVSLT